MEAQGISVGPKFVRIKMPTVGEPLWKQWVVAFSRPRIELLEDYEVLLPTGQTVILPKGMNSDGGSVPMFLIWFISSMTGYMGGWLQVFGIVLMLLAILLNPFGLMLVAFLLHDYALKYGKLILKGGGHLVVRSVWHANSLMRQVNFMINDMIFLGLVAHTAVTIGAWIAWVKHRRAENES